MANQIEFGHHNRSGRIRCPRTLDTKQALDHSLTYLKYLISLALSLRRLENRLSLALYLSLCLALCLRVTECPASL